MDFLQMAKFWDNQFFLHQSVHWKNCLIQYCECNHSTYSSLIKLVSKNSHIFTVILFPLKLKLIYTSLSKNGAAQFIVFWEKSILHARYSSCVFYQFLQNYQPNFIYSASIVRFFGFFRYIPSQYYQNNICAIFCLNQF